MLLKLLIISFIVIYVIARFAGFFFRVANWLLGNPVKKRAESHYRKYQPSPDFSTKEKNGLTIRIPQNKKHTPKTFKGGEYVDFEEIDEK